ncbi:MAG: trypsin-like peptidase domain-containing protein [Hyphomicrobiales bacterium]|nr:trypsin-like peptidase domain-containing protein [Hyphomicrobiales bacterium]
MHRIARRTAPGHGAKSSRSNASIWVGKALAAALLALSLVSAAADGERAATALASVVSVLPEWPSSAVRAAEPEGSGVAVLDGHYVITALHVVDRALSVRVKTVGGIIFGAEIIGRDRATDLALLRVAVPLPALAFADEPRLGEEVCALGNAFGLGVSVSCGVVSALHRSGVGFNGIEDFVQTDAAVNPGASGGALVNGGGELVGILSAIFTKQSDANIGVNFAVSAPLADRVARELKASGRVRWLAAGMHLTAAPETGGTGRVGAHVASLAPAGAAAAAGLKVGDLVVGAGRRAVHGPADFVAALARVTAPGDLAVTVLRDGSEVTLTLRFDEDR